ncbi:hypothetical protein H8B02_20870 [Bradyrhizobium sp. Pear77]|nr:hypothetical protein [Bradyrhizobium altum]
MVVDRGHEFGNTGGALRSHHPKFSETAADRIDCLGALTHQEVAGAKHNAAACCSTLLTATKRSQIASASVASFICHLTEGFT